MTLNYKDPKLDPATKQQLFIIFVEEELKAQGKSIKALEGLEMGDFKNKTEESMDIVVNKLHLLRGDFDNFRQSNRQDKTKSFWDIFKR